MNRWGTGAVLLCLLAAFALPAATSAGAIRASRPDAPPRWAQFRTDRTFLPGDRESRVGGIRHILVAGERLVYAAAGEVGCVDARTGKAAWRWDPPPRAGGPDPYWGDHGWRLLLVGGRVIAGEVRTAFSAERPRGAFRVQCLNLLTGARGWSALFPIPTVGPPVLRGEQVEITLEDGQVFRFALRTGKLRAHRNSILSDEFREQEIRFQPLLAVYRGLRLSTEMCPVNAAASVPPYAGGELLTVVAADPETGAVHWRWQPYEGFFITSMAAVGDRVIVSDGSTIRAVRPGAPSPLPTDPALCRSLARRMVWHLTHWRLPTEDGPPQEDAQPTSSDSADPGCDPGWREPEFTLLRLGSESVAPLMASVRQAASEVNDKRMPEGFHGFSWSQDLYREPLQVLAKIGDARVEPELERFLLSSTDRQLRRALAEALIEIGDRRSREALFRYACSEGDSPAARRAALYFVCRTSRPDAPAGSENPARSEVTQYLLRELNDTAAPGWLRAFARFELVNDRGDTAARAAEAAFQTTNDPERPIGINPGNRDPKGNVLPDNEDRRPLDRPRALTDEEGIYQAVLDALDVLRRADTGSATEGEEFPPVDYSL